MAISSKYFALPTLIGAGLTLAACGGSGAANEAFYQEFAKSCSSSLTSEGVPAEMAKPICDCSTEEVRAQELGPLDLVNEEKMSAIAEECMNQTIPGMDAGGADAAPEAEAPAE